MIYAIRIAILAAMYFAGCASRSFLDPTPTRLGVDVAMVVFVMWIGSYDRKCFLGAQQEIYEMGLTRGAANEPK